MSVSQRKRFEVFKRDGFRCAYCGKTPPEVILEADHIIPVSKGGSDDMENLITSCQECNRGKSNVELTKIPHSLEENIANQTESAMQLIAYNKFMKKLMKQKEEQAENIEKIFQEYFPNKYFTNLFKQNSLIRIFLKHLPFEEVIEAMYVSIGVVGKRNDPEKVLKYFCGICWRKIRRMENGQN